MVIHQIAAPAGFTMPWCFRSACYPKTPEAVDTKSSKRPTLFGESKIMLRIKADMSTESEKIRIFFLSVDMSAFFRHQDNVKNVSTPGSER